VIDAYARKGESEKSVEHYTSVVYSYARKKQTTIGSAKCAERVFSGSLDFYEDFRLAPARPDATLVATMLDVWAKTPMKAQLRAQRTRELIENMGEKYQIECDVRVYNAYLNILVSCGDHQSTRQAEDVLAYLESHDTLQPNVYSYNAVLKALSKQQMGNKAEALLMRWIRRYRDGKITDIPDWHSFCTVLNGWTSPKKGNNISGKKAEEILDWMGSHDVPLNLPCYNAALKVCSQTSGLDSPIIAKRIWDRMPEKDRESYHFMINCLGRSDNFRNACKAEHILREGVDSQTLCPDPQLCNVVVSAFANGRHATSGVRAEQFLAWMTSVGVEPTTQSYNSAISGHVKSARPVGVDKALNLYMRMRAEPSAATYSILVEGCAGRPRDVEELFKDCIGRGLLDKKLLKDFRDVGTAALRSQLGGDIP